MARDILEFVKKLKEFDKEEDFEYFYRGHSNVDYPLLPAIYRQDREGNSLIENEHKIFREVIIRTPNDFTNEKTAIEKLVKMQHYDIPTRLLDITSNPLVALYFACRSNREDKPGEVIIFKIPKNKIKYYDSDTVSILANIAKRPSNFDITKQLEVYKRPGNVSWGSGNSLLSSFNKEGDVPYLIHDIKEEKPYFSSIIDPNDFNQVLPVRVKLNNSRIAKQGGSFLLFGIKNSKKYPADIPIDWIVKHSWRKVEINIAAENKLEMLQDLDALGINESTLYPELDKQAKYITALFT